MRYTSFAALAIISTTAAAQSSVTLYGVADIGVQHARQGAASVNVVSGGGNSAPSRIGFRGTEDLGGGLTAGFVLEAGMNVDNGSFGTTSANNQTAAPAAGLVFNRRSYLSLRSRDLGELRLGREYVPSYWNVSSQYDPFTNVGAGAMSHLTSGALNQISTTFIQTGIRASNSVSYQTPDRFDGFFAQTMLAFGENASNVALPAGPDDGNYSGIRAGYARKDFDVAIAWGKTKRLAGDVSVANLAAAYDFGSFRLTGTLFSDNRDTAVPATAANQSRGWAIAASIPVGAGYIPLSYGTVRDNRALPTGNAKASQLAIGYVYKLSKRTSLYATAATIINKGGANVTGGNVPGVANARWSGQDVGVRVDF